MPLKKVNLDPAVSPKAYYEANQEELGVIPDGTGLQILFNVEGKKYVLAGPRTDKVLTVNGGSIENNEVSFLAQLQEELSEETFGVLSLLRNGDNYVLRLNDGSEHALSMRSDQTVLKHKPGKYAYLTFTAECDSLSLDQLKSLATAMSPTAMFWSKVGGYLFPHTRNAPKDDAAFAEYWKAEFSNRSEAIQQMLVDYANFRGAGLLVEPTAVFSSSSVEQALNKLHEVCTYADLQRLFKHTVGRFSERAGYYVFDAAAVLTSAKSETDLSDVNGNQVAKGVFNDDAVTAVFPSLGVVGSEFAPVQTAGVLAAKTGAFAPVAQVVDSAPVKAEETFGLKL